MCSVKKRKKETGAILFNANIINQYIMLLAAFTASKMYKRLRLGFV